MDGLTMTARQARVVGTMLGAQARWVDGFEGCEGRAGAFGDHRWTRPATDGGRARGGGRAGGGGRARVLEGGRVFERGGVNVSAVVGDTVPPSLAAEHPGTEGRPWFATGVSMVLHPRNPYVPAIHANFRYFEVGEGLETGADPAAATAAPPRVWWFGGGIDLTPAYPVEDDVRAFHGALAAWCARHPQADHATWKATCDAYFTVRHRHEMRGVGGVFFDELTPPADPGRSFEADLACVEDGIATLLPTYLPLVERHLDTPYGERQRRWQAIRRGRYAEFNLVYDRGTRFGLQTGGHIEAILMSMPPVASWAFDHRPEPGGPEAAALAFYQPRDWCLGPEGLEPEGLELEGHAARRSA